jgi:hypothetical protein
MWPLGMSRLRLISLDQISQFRVKDLSAPVFMGVNGRLLPR